MLSRYISVAVASLGALAAACGDQGGLPDGTRAPCDGHPCSDTSELSDPSGGGEAANCCPEDANGAGTGASSGAEPPDDSEFTGTGGAGGDDTTSPGACDSGSAETQWASSCRTSPHACTAGTWVAGPPHPEQASFNKCTESEHFVVYSDEPCTAGASAATAHLETVWEHYFGAPLFMEPPLCDSATKYKATVHVHSDWGLTAGSWNGNRMGMWIGTGGQNDHWGLAHEFMHGVQSVSGGQQCNQSNTCGWIYESHANWAAQQQTEYHQSELHCSEMLANMPHLYLGSTRDRYCNWQFMEYLKDKHCAEAVNAIWTGQTTSDPFSGIRSAMGWSVSELNDFMGDWAMHNVIWDYQDPAPQSANGHNQGALYRARYGNITDRSQSIRALRTTKLLPLGSDSGNTRRFYSPDYWAPQRYGYNVVRLKPDAGATEVTVKFRGVSASPASPDWRYGLVATSGDFTEARYSKLSAGQDGEVHFCIAEGEELFLVVTATPSEWYNIVWDQPYNTVPRYPYMVELTSAWPEGFTEGGAQTPCPAGLSRATNGGGCAPAGTTAYVGPYATVMTGASATGNARIEDHAIVASGTVSGGTVGALTIVGSTGGYGATAFNVSSGTARTTFYPLGFFAGGQSLAGGTLVGDVELQGANVTRSSGTCSGYVDGSTCAGPGSDLTPLAPYTWR